MTKIVAIVAVLDTKGAEAQLIRDYVASQGLTPLIIDVGVLGSPAIPFDIPRDEIAAAGGAELGDLVRTQDKARAMAAMTRGAAVVAARLYAEGRLDGVIGLGGSAGTLISTSAMR